MRGKTPSYIASPSGLGKRDDKGSVEVARMELPWQRCTESSEEARKEVKVEVEARSLAVAVSAGKDGWTMEWKGSVDTSTPSKE